MLWKVNENEVISFLEHFFLNKFGFPDSLIFGNACYFSLMKLVEFALENGIKIKYYTNYYPHGMKSQNHRIRT